MANTGFDLINSKKCLHSFSSVFVFKQAKEKVCLIKVQPLKIINIKKFVAHLKGNTHNFLRPCYKWKGNTKTWNFGIDVLKPDNVSFLFFQNHSTLLWGIGLLLQWLWHPEVGTRLLSFLAGFCYSHFFKKDPWVTFLCIIRKNIHIFIIFVWPSSSRLKFSFS